MMDHEPVQLLFTHSQIPLSIWSPKVFEYQTETDSLNAPGTWDMGAKDWGSNTVLWLQGFRTAVLEIKKCCCSGSYFLTA